MTQTLDAPSMPPTSLMRGEPARPPTVAAHRGIVERSSRLVMARLAECPAWVLVTQTFIGLGWIRAAVEKIITSGWWTGESLSTFLAVGSGRAVGWFQPFLDLVVSPHLVVVSVVVVVAELVAGASLLAGKFLPTGLAVGIALNLSFVATGAVNPSAFYILAQGALALWLVEGVVTRRSMRQLAAASITGGALALTSLPWVRTLAPHSVIEDPAAMLVTGGVLTVLATEIVLSRASTTPERPDHLPATIVRERDRV